MSKPGRGRSWRAWVKPLVGLGLLAVVAGQLELDELRALLAAGEPRLLLYGTLGFFVSLSVFQSSRLHLLVSGYTGGFAASLRLFFVGAFFNNLLPSNVGGDAVRLMYLKRMGDKDWAAPLALLLLHRLSGLLTIVAAFSTYLLVDGAELFRRLAGKHIAVGTSWLGPAFVSAAVLALAGRALILRTEPGRRLRARLGEAWGRMAGAIVGLSRPRLWTLLLLTMAFHGSRMVGFYFCVRYFGQSIPMWDLVPVLMLTAVMGLLPITVGGLGVVEGSIGLGLGLFGVAPAAAIATALVNRLVMVAIALVGGGLYASRRPD